MNTPYTSDASERYWENRMKYLQDRFRVSSLSVSYQGREIGKDPTEQEASPKSKVPILTSKQILTFASANGLGMTVTL